MEQKQNLEKLINPLLQAKDFSVTLALIEKRLKKSTQKKIIINCFSLTFIENLTSYNTHSTTHAAFTKDHITDHETDLNKFGNEVM